MIKNNQLLTPSQSKFMPSELVRERERHYLIHELNDPWMKEICGYAGMSYKLFIAKCNEILEGKFSMRPYLFGRNQFKKRLHKEHLEKNYIKCPKRTKIK
jgi:hypothetical protein